MTTFAFGSSTPHHLPRSFLSALWTRLAGELAARRAERMLNGMDDTLLHDIGVGRGEIGDAVRHGRGNGR